MYFLENSWLLLVFLPVLLLGSICLSYIGNDNRANTKLNFLVAGRQIATIPAAFSIAAAWIWAPSLFVSSQKAFLDGWVGLFWFVVPNILCLVLFAFFAQIMRKINPKGFTLSGMMRTQYSDRVQSIYWFTLLGLTICAFAVQLLAGGKLLSLVAGWNFTTSVLVLAIIPLTYSLAFGLRSSILTDFAKIIALLLGFAFLIPELFQVIGYDTIVKGLSGSSNNVADLFDDRGMSIFLAFGLPVTIGLMSGPFGDQAFWQRAFAIEKTEKVRNTFIYAACIFGIVPICMGLIGFAAAGSGFVPNDPQMVNLEFITSYLPKWVGYLFVFIVLSGIVSILDSKLCATASIAGHDFAQRISTDNSNSLLFSRVSMVVLTLLAIGIALIPGLQIVHLFLFYGTLRASTLLPTIYTLVCKSLPSEKAVFWGILVAVSIGLPLFGYATLNKLTTLSVLASLFTVFTPLIVIIISILCKFYYRDNKTIASS